MTRYYTSDIEGGRVKNPFKKLGKKIDRGMLDAARGFSEYNPITQIISDPTVSGAMRDIGQFTNDELLPGAVSIGIPVASQALGALGAMYGIPPEVTSGMTQSLLETYIPKQYQSDNPYVQQFSGALTAGMSGDPNAMANLQTGLSAQVSSDLYKGDKTTPTTQYQTQSNPYESFILKLLSKQGGLSSLVDTVNDDNDAQYKNSKLASDGDTMTNATPPYQQREGSAQALLGAGIKKKRGRPMKEIVRVEIIEKMPHQKFSGSKNASLDQLLSATSAKEDKEMKKALKDMIKSQSKALKSVGFGIGKPLKGSEEAKDWGRKMKEAREAKRKSKK
jgi:hypothetical protein